MEQGRRHRIRAQLTRRTFADICRRWRSRARIQTECGSIRESPPLALLLARWQTLPFLVAEFAGSRGERAVRRHARLVRREVAYEGSINGGIRVWLFAVPAGSDPNGEAARSPKSRSHWRRNCCC